MSSLVNELEKLTLWSEGEGRWTRAETTEVVRVDSRGSKDGMLWKTHCPVLETRFRGWGGHRPLDGLLPPCVMTMQRKNRSYGYFCGNRWANHTGTLRDEIALNPVHFATRSVAEVLSTLGHEMVHLWQYPCGTPSRAGSHNGVSGQVWRWSD